MRDLVRFLSFRSYFFGMAAVGAVLTALRTLAGMPTLLFNGRGDKEQESVFVIDRARVLYWLDKQKA